MTGRGATFKTLQETTRELNQTIDILKKDCEWYWYSTNSLPNNMAQARLKPIFGPDI